MRRWYEVYVGAWNNFEIDFVAIDKQWVDVTTREREFGNLHKIKDNYDKYVLTMDTLEASNNEGIKRMHIIDWLTG